jgi:chromosome segregation ATPase
MEGKMNEMSQSLDFLEGTVNESIEGIRDNITSIEGIIGELRFDIEGIHTMIANLDDGIDSSDLERIQREFTNLSSYLNRISDRIDSMETDWSKSGLTLGELRENLTELRTELDEAREDIVEIQSTSSDTELEYLRSDLEDMRERFQLLNTVFIGFMFIFFILICVIVGFWYRLKRHRNKIEGSDLPE